MRQLRDLTTFAFVGTVDVRAYNRDFYPVAAQGRELRDGVLDEEPEAPADDQGREAGEQLGRGLHLGRREGRHRHRSECPLARAGACNLVHATPLLKNV